MRCASCGFENPEGAKFCNQCGTSLKRPCAQCSFENAPQAKFCGECGTPLAVAGQPQAAKSRKRIGTTRTKRARRPTTAPTTVKPRPAAQEAARSARRQEVASHKSTHVSSESIAWTKEKALPTSRELGCLSWRISFLLRVVLPNVKLDTAWVRKRLLSADQIQYQRYTRQ